MAIPTPLTTVFTPPPECLSTIFWSSGGQYQLGYSTECIPSGPAPSLSSYFSPGLYCPESYTVACTGQVILGAASTETQAVCCPKLDGIATGRFAEASFRCNTDQAMPWYSSLGCTMNFGTAATEGPITALYTKSSTTYTTTYSAAATDGLNAYSVKIAWQASDLAQSTSTSATASSTANQAASESTGIARTTANSSPDPAVTSVNLASESQGLPTTTKIVIGIVIPIIIIALIIIGLLLIRRKRRTARVDEPKVELRSELGSRPIYEKDSAFSNRMGSHSINELAGETIRSPQELPGHEVMPRW